MNNKATGLKNEKEMQLKKNRIFHKDIRKNTCILGVFWYNKFYEKERRQTMNIDKVLTNIKSKDDRSRFLLTPVSVVKVWGNVLNIKNLLEAAVPQVTFDGSLTPKGHLESAVMKNDGGEHAAFLLDFGREIHGTFRLYMGVPGAKLLIRLGESISEAINPIGGEKNATNNHAVRDAVFNVSAMSHVETAESGFRFVYVELLDETEVRVTSLESTLICYDTPEVGDFSCSDELVNRIYHTAAYTLRLCMQRYVWDGIKRDRLIWIGDMNTEIKTCLNLYGGSEVIKRSLDFVRDTTPVTDWMNGIPSYSVWWVVCHYDYFIGSGDFTYLKEQQSYLTDLLPRLASAVSENGEEDLPEMKFIDWPNRANIQATHAGLQGILRMGLLKGASMMELLGDHQTAAICEASAAKLLTVHTDPNGSKQAAAFLTLAGIEPAEEMAKKLLLPGGAKGYSTFLGYYTLKATAAAGRHQEALDTMRTYWGKMLELGATTFWEDFNMDWAENAYGIDSLPVEGKKDIHGDFGGYCYVGLRHSLCHGWSSGPVSYLAEEVLGVRFIQPGGKVVTISPHLSDLSFAEGKVPTAFGPIWVRHEKDSDGVVHTSYKAPEGVTVL